MAEKRKIEIGPQPGPQTEALATKADIALFGGGAGGGKSFFLLLDPLRNIFNPKFGAVTFRRTTKQIRNEGGLWDESLGIYAPLGAIPKSSTLEWTFRSGMRTQFAHLEYEKNVLDWQGSQIPWIGFDELTHFTRHQFFYMLSRNRSTSGVPGTIRATTNPDAESWVRLFIDWWIDNDTGFPIRERSGKLRWFVRNSDEIFWGDSREELIKRFGPAELPKSFTFIPSSIFDNKILMEKDPAYVANLRALSRVERMKLLEGNWNAKATAGAYFQKPWFEVVDAIPAGCKSIRYWDRASTKPSESNPDPDWTVGLKLEKSANGLFFVSDVVRVRESPLEVERAILNTARQDGIGTTIYIEQDPGQAGVVEATNYTRLLAGFVVKTNKVNKDKVSRAQPVSAQVEAGNVKLMRGSWNESLLVELQAFPDGKHDDQVDALSGAFNMHLLANVGTFTEKMAKNPTRGTIAGKLGAMKW